MKLKYWILVFFVLSTATRLFFNFSQELIPGVNGGYYPLQVRSILMEGQLGFSDMPLLFYLDALIVKFVTFFGFSVTDTLILNVVKIVDSISLPLLLLPLYKMIRLSNSSKIIQISIFAFSVLSFSPLILTSDLQKNSLAITLIVAAFASFFSFQIDKRKIEIVWSTIFLFLTGLTHFGTFVFGLFFLLIIIVYRYKKRAIIPIVLITIVGLGIVFINDISRFNRLLSIWSLIFEKPALMNGMLSPPDMFIILLSIILGVIGIMAIRKKKDELSINQKAFIFASSICLLTCSFPLLDGEYFKRLSLFLFIPQLFLIIQLSSVISLKQQKTIGILLFIFTFLSILAVLGHPKETVIDENAHTDLKKLQSVLTNIHETLIISRHALEWWTALLLKTKVGQDKAIDKSTIEKYKTIIVLNQINGFSSEMERSPFHEPFHQ
jgi:hypothetical protein